MTKTGKVLGIGAAVAAIGALGALAFAQGPHGLGFHGMGQGMKMGMGHGPMGGRMGNPRAGLADTKAELAITPAQESAWLAYEKVIEDTATAQRAQHQAIDRDALHKMAPNDRYAFMADQRAQRRQAFETVKAAAEKLLAALDEAQQAKAREVLPGLADAGHGLMRHGMVGDHEMPGPGGWH